MYFMSLLQRINTNKRRKPYCIYTRYEMKQKNIKNENGIHWNGDEFMDREQRQANGSKLVVDNCPTPDRDVFSIAYIRDAGEITRLHIMCCSSHVIPETNSTLVSLTRTAWSLQLFCSSRFKLISRNSKPTKYHLSLGYPGSVRWQHV